MFIPLSGLTGANVKDRVSSDACEWWDKMVADGENNTKQGTLLEILNELHMVSKQTLLILLLLVHCIIGHQAALSTTSCTSYSSKQSYNVHFVHVL
jgi:translation elongation factor EF-1alpha